MKSVARTPPRIVFAATLWSLTEHPSPKREWSLAMKMRAISEAGFDAVAARAGPEHRRPLDRFGLRLGGVFSSSDPREFRKLIRKQRDAGAEVINVQIGDDFTPVDTATKMAIALLKEAKRQGIYTSIEAHRDTATETPEKLYAISDGYKQATGELMPITWDHSHLAIIKHLRPGQFSEVLLARPELIRHARSFHCRPFNGHHCQVPVFDGNRRITSEFLNWLVFAEDLFKCWLSGPRPGNELWVCPEIGPVAVHGYNLTTMPQSWPQAIICRRELAKLWIKLGGAIGSD